MNDYVALTLGMLCAGAGGELLLRGALGLAACLRIPTLVTRSSVAVFAYAGAEISVVIQAAQIDRPEMAIGAAFGTSIVNLGLVLAVAWLTSDGVTRIDAKRWHCALAALAPCAVLFFARNGVVSRNEGGVLCALFAAWLIAAIVAARTTGASREGAEPLAEQRGWLAISFSFVGLLLLATAGRLIVHGIDGLALHFQLSFFVLGATLAPLCTTVPELTHAVATQYRGGENTSTATLLDNCLLNAWFLAGLAAIIAPTRVPFNSLALAVAAAAALPLLVWPNDRVSARLRGLALLAIYGVFLAYMM